MIPDDYWTNLDDILYRRTLPDDIAAAGDELRDRVDWGARPERPRMTAGPLNCPECGRFMADSGSTGHADAIREWEVCWGRCKVHGDQEWSTR